MKKLFYFLAIISHGIINAQVGIETTTPKSTLHIAGDLTLNSSFNVGGDDNTVGDSGKKGEILQSQGMGIPPIWTSVDSVLMPQSFSKTQTNNVFLPAGYNMPWVDIPNLSQSVTIPAGKKALITISGQICVQQTKDSKSLWGISGGIFANNETFPLISFTGQLVNNSLFVEEFINIPVSYSEFILANQSDVTKVYKIKGRVNYGSGNDVNDVRVINNPFNRGDYSQLRISVLIF